MAELFLGCVRLGDHAAAPLSNHLRGRVKAMMEYWSAVLRPDGLMPQSGDADDGRLHVLRDSSPQDGRHLLGPAAVLFDHQAWFTQGGGPAVWEAAWWGFGTASRGPDRVPAVATLFRDAGHAVYRDGGNYLLITNSIVGTKGFGNHKHNDQLSFEYHAGGGPLIVDPGSYVYTADPSARNLFRSTAYHNTLAINGAEQHKINPEWLFRVFEQGRAEHLLFQADSAAFEYHGRHHGYAALPEPVIHERRFRLDRGSGRLDITDRLTGQGAHRVSWHFHFAPGVTATADPGGCRLSAAWATLRIELPSGANARISDVWYSPSYGVRLPCLALDFTLDTVLKDSSEWRVALIPGTAGLHA